jgi:hypothetical protein
MADTPKKKKGRPRKVIDPQLVEALAATGAPIIDIAFEVGCHPATLRRRFSDVLEAGYARTRNRLRNKQVQVALAGNVPMLIHLGKAALGQNVERKELTGVDGAPLMPILVVRRESEDDEL